MSSKILVGESRNSVQQMEWRRAPLAPVSQAKPNLYAQAGRSGPAPEELSENTRREIEAQVQAAFQRGYREGEGAATQAGAAKVNAAVERFARTVEELSSHRTRLRRQAEADLVKLAIAIARRVLRREISVDPEALVGIARAALDKLGATESCRLRVNPAHAAALTRYFEGAGAKVEVIPDRALDPGSAIFETSGGSLDAGLETQLCEIERGLTDLCKR